MNVRRGFSMGLLTLVGVGTGACDLGGPPFDETDIVLDVRYSVGYNGLRRLNATFTATNLNTVPVNGEMWIWEFRAYDNPDRRGDPVWSGEAPPGNVQGGREIHLPPGVPVQFRYAFSSTYDEILGSAGPGTLYFSARLLKRDLSPWTEWLPAGSFELTQ